MTATPTTASITALISANRRRIVIDSSNATPLTELANVAPAEHLAYRHGELFLENVAIADSARERRTPFFLLSASRLRRNVERLRSELGGAIASAPGMAETTAPPVGPTVRLRYCAKANHEAGVLEVLAGCGVDLLASHLVEVELALRCGFAPTAIAYQRPVLERADVETAARLGVDLFHVHRLDDLDLLEAAATAAGRPLRVSLRLNDPGRSGQGAFAWFNRRLGLSAAASEAAARRVAGSRALRLAGLNFYLGTQLTPLAPYTRGLRAALRLGARWRSELGLTIDEINIGGGIPSPRLRRLRPSGLLARWRDRGSGDELGGPALGRGIAREYLREAAAAGWASPPALVAEPGRSVVGDAGIVVTRVRAVHGRWLFLDASRAFLPESSLLFSRRLLPVRPRNGSTRFWHLSGASLNTLDVLDLHRRLPPVEPDDLLVIADAGAYSISRASRYAVSLPAVYLLDEDGSVREIRAAEGMREFAAAMRFQTPADGSDRSPR